MIEKILHTNIGWYNKSDCMFHKYRYNTNNDAPCYIMPFSKFAVFNNDKIEVNLNLIYSMVGDCDKSVVNLHFLLILGQLLLTKVRSLYLNKDIIFIGYIRLIDESPIRKHIAL